MLHEQLTKNLKKGETLVRIIQRDVLASIRPFLLAALLILLDFFLLVYLVRSGPWGIVVFVVLLLSALIIALRSVIEWRLNAFVLTSERIIHVYQKGFFTRTVSETTYDKVTDVRFSVQGVFQTAFNLGSIEVQTAGEGENLRLQGIRRPPEVQALITTILRAAREDANAPLTAQELVAALTRAKHELGEKAFNEIISRLPGQSKKPSP